MLLGGLRNKSPVASILSRSSWASVWNVPPVISDSRFIRGVLLSRSANSGEYGTVTPARPASTVFNTALPSLLSIRLPSLSFAGSRACTLTKYDPASSAANSASYSPPPLDLNSTCGAFSPGAACFGAVTAPRSDTPLTGRSFSSRTSAVTRTRPSRYSVVMVNLPRSGSRITQLTTCSQNLRYISEPTHSLSQYCFSASGWVRASEVNATALPRPYRHDASSGNC